MIETIFKIEFIFYFVLFLIKINSICNTLNILGKSYNC